MEHSRSLAPGHSPAQLAATEAHIREHLAAAADADDDPTTRSADVDILHVRDADGGMTVLGFLDAVPDAPYLRPGYDPAAEARPDWLVWTPADQPEWDPHLADVEPADRP